MSDDVGEVGEAAGSLMGINGQRIDNARILHGRAAALQPVRRMAAEKLMKF
ncbi:hypothetical protein GCM10007171_35410 [Dickeya fangzhongdai]|nr:hypothetical protein GCM10007171_35410 [Dickeya fangzhongdai]